MIRIIAGDCRVALAEFDACSFDACVTDPPYHLTTNKRGGSGAASDNPNSPAGRARIETGFMGKAWDGGDVAFQPETWAAVLRVLKPGAHLLCFGGTRTYHQLACAIEDAGFEIRDAIMWHYGSGFPKSHDVSKGIDRAAGAEREVVGRTNRKVGPQGTRCVAGLHGSSTFRENPDNPGNLETAPATDAARQWAGWGTALKPATEIICLARKPLIGTVAANVLAHGCGGLNIDGCRVETEEARPWREAAVPLSGDGSQIYGDFAKEGSRAVGDTTLGRWPANLIHDGSEEVLEAFPDAPGQQRFVGAEHGDRDSVNCYGDYGPRTDTAPRGDIGSAARFFYTSKADATDRLQSKHPTVKPVDLIRYLCRLVTQPGGHVLDPFAGSGTTGMAAMAEGFNATLIEREAEYVADIRRRVAHVSGGGTPLFAEVAD